LSINQPNPQPTLPLTFYSATTVRDSKYMLVSNGLAGQKEQKVLQIYIVDIYAQEGTAVPKRDFVTDESTCYLHKKNF